MSVEKVETSKETKMAARSHVTYLTVYSSQSPDLHNEKTTTTITEMEEHEEMSCIKSSKARPLTASYLGSFRAGKTLWSG